MQVAEHKNRKASFIEIMEKQILSGERKPGDRLPPERELAAQLGFSRGSVNRGMLDLARMGCPAQGRVCGRVCAAGDAGDTAGAAGRRRDFAVVQGENREVYTELAEAGCVKGLEERPDEPEVQQKYLLADERQKSTHWLCRNGEFRDT